MRMRDVAIIDGSVIRCLAALKPIRITVRVYNCAGLLVNKPKSAIGGSGDLVSGFQAAPCGACAHGQ